ncbi:ArsC/Spx/MgsR family protein [Herminiimonas fonticola]|uniref:Arsenate reductase n=1 Tax=Herminiimonas fonticola TaxID=303380 RepID=A0A4R6GG50_9BURK|nr:ArsC/Spx/MgsR family protein [Herminiimonas fonticola]RBA24785.1 Arsenate reductase and related proteins glutaredoxin family [Herminiimonas fonticola]TDN93899.1 arsenate reductase [Herminiimonas fonticola]
MLIIYHNPRCSKSREALELTQQFATQHQLDLDVVDYQKTPLTLPQLTELHQVLQSEQAVSVLDMTRGNEELFATLALQDASDDTLLQALAAHPQLLQRPIIRFNHRAVIARPPELVNAILQVQ